MNRGFTLVELSIVLVIIGLVIAGVMFGRDMVEDAEHNALMSQIEELDAATNAFRLKYGGIPGDLDGTKALAFGLYGVTGTPGRMDNDGRLMGDWQGLLTDCIGGQWGIGDNTIFAPHLHEAKMYVSGASADGGNYAGIGVGEPYMLAEGLDDVGIWPFTYCDGKGWYGLFLSPANYSAGVGLANHIAASNQLKPMTAKIIDTKFDDGLPNTGRIRNTTISGGAIHIEPWGTSNSNCVDGGADTDDYTVSSEEQRCWLSIRSEVF